MAEKRSFPELIISALAEIVILLKEISGIQKKNGILLDTLDKHLYTAYGVIELQNSILKEQTELLKSIQGNSFQTEIAIIETKQILKKSLVEQKEQGNEDKNDKN